MTLKYTQDIDCIIPKSISFNYAEMEAELSSMLCECQCDVNEENIKERKELRARINKLASAFKAERTSMKKKFLAPLEDFNKKIDTLVGNCEIVINILDEGIKRIEDARKADKIDLLSYYLADCIHDSVMKGIIPKEIENSESWSVWFLQQKQFGNVTYSIESAKQDCEEKVREVAEGIGVLAATYPDKKDYGKALLVYLRHSFNLAETVAEMKQFMDEQKAVANAVAHAAPPDPNSLYDEWTVEMRITTNMEQMKMLSQYMKDNCIKFTVTKKMSKAK